jgi:hypothetical protein
MKVVFGLLFVVALVGLIVVIFLATKWFFISVLSILAFVVLGYVFCAGMDFYEEVIKGR